MLLHFIALHCSFGCLVGLSELQSVHRAVGGLGGCFLWLCLLLLCMLIAPVLVVFVESCISIKLR